MQLRGKVIEPLVQVGRTKKYYPFIAIDARIRLRAGIAALRALHRDLVGQFAPLAQPAGPDWDMSHLGELAVYFVGHDR